MKLNYVYGERMENSEFMKYPKALIEGEEFKEISFAAKTLYVVLQNRTELSLKNGWFDSENRVYIIFQISEIQKKLNISKYKAMKLLSELEEFGLVEKKRRGLGLPNLLYVKRIVEDDKVLVENESAEDAESVVEKPSRDENTYVSRVEELFTSRSTENDICEDSITALLEVPEYASINNYTKENYTDSNNPESNHILSEKKEVCESRSVFDEKNENISGDEKGYIQLIKKNICYHDLLITHPMDSKVISEILELICEILMCSGENMVIASNTYPMSIVKSRFLKLNYQHIVYVLECLQNNTSEVNNIKKYLLAALFNAPSTMVNYYLSEVNHNSEDLKSYTAFG